MSAEKSPDWFVSRMMERHAQIAAQPLAETCGGHLSHDEVASKVRMLMRHDLDHEAVCNMGRDRIVWLAGQVDALQAKLDHNRCNSGHETLPLVLWDCPECHQRTRDKLAKLVEAANAAHMALIGYLPAHRNDVTDAAIEQLGEALEFAKREGING